MHTYEAPIPAPEFVYTDGRYDMEATDKAEQEYTNTIIEFAKKQEPHKLAGCVVRTPIADGSANYVVAKIAGKVSLIHLAFGDAWRDNRLEQYGTVRELTDLIEREDRINKLFGR